MTRILFHVTEKYYTDFILFRVGSTWAGTRTKVTCMRYVAEGGSW